MKNTFLKYYEQENDSSFFPAALTIAGSDCGGGAGVQADLRTFSAFGVYGCSAITALTAQNPAGISGIFPVDPAFVTAQISVVLEMFQIGAAKTGMLGSAEMVKAVTSALKNFKGILTVDPVIFSTSGTPLLQESAVKVLEEELLPMADWITPNRQEAEVLSGIRIRTESDALQAALCCARKFQCGIVLKGGHFSGTDSADLILPGPGEKAYTISAERLTLAPLTGHGPGCTFSAAMTAAFAMGAAPDQAVKQAKQFVFDSLKYAVSPGKNFKAMFPKDFIK